MPNEEWDGVPCAAAARLWLSGVDQVVVGPSGVLVVDSQRWTGAAHVRRDVLPRRGRLRKKALGGATRAALAVADLLDEPRQHLVQPVVCFARDERIMGAGVAGSWSARARRARSMLLTQATVLSEGERAAMCATSHCGSGPPRTARATPRLTTPGGGFCKSRTMHFVGVDLAWGVRRPTGLAVLDDDGRLLHVASESSDDAIAAALAPYVAGECLVAIDAPLVVTNATGNRPAEAELNKDFRAFEAGAHPTNTGKSEFRDGPRGGRLAERLGLDLDPSSEGGRRAIEVYPHAAIVALFRLGRTLKYKDKRGRTLDDLRSELLRLMTLLEGLRDADTPLRLDGSPAWAELVTQVREAGRKSDLRKVEDQVDAVVCAYVALYAEREPKQVTTYGDLANGYIVTPSLPEGLTAAPRPTRAEAGARAGAHRVRRPAAGTAPRERRRGRAGHRHPRRRGHQLPEHQRPGQVRRVVRRQGGRPGG